MRNFVSPAEVKDIIKTSMQALKNELVSQGEVVWSYKNNEIPIPVGQLQQLVSQKKIPFYKVGKHVIFLKSEIINWIKNNGEMYQQFEQ